jgi:hypothetical protein
MGFNEQLLAAAIGSLIRSGMSVVMALGLSTGSMAENGATGAIRPEQTPAAQATPKSSRLDAEGSCWYAIYFCSRGPDEALRWTEGHAHGRVIDTLSLEFPRLKKGYYCAVDGPLPRKAAIDRAQNVKRSRRAPGAYAKEAC